MEYKSNKSFISIKTHANNNQETTTSFPESSLNQEDLCKDTFAKDSEVKALMDDFNQKFEKTFYKLSK